MTANQEYGNGRTSTIIELESTEEVRKAQIVTEAFYNYRSNSVIFRLNPRYQGLLIDSPIDLKDPKRTTEELCEHLESNGVTTDDIEKLGDMLNDNYDRIVKHYAQQTLEQTSIGQRAKERVEKLKKWISYRCCNISGINDA